MRRVLTLLAVLGAVAGCAANYPVTGSTAGGEQFRGVFRMAADGGPTGDMEMTSPRTRCVGRYQFGDHLAATVLLTCEDGRSGVADLSSQAKPWTMKGKLGGQPFTAVVTPERL